MISTWKHSPLLSLLLGFAFFTSCADNDSTEIQANRPTSPAPHSIDEGLANEKSDVTAAQSRDFNTSTRPEAPESDDEQARDANPLSSTPDRSKTDSSTSTDRSGQDADSSANQSSDKNGTTTIDNSDVKEIDSDSDAN